MYNLPHRSDMRREPKPKLNPLLPSLMAYGCPAQPKDEPTDWDWESPSRNQKKPALSVYVTVKKSIYLPTTYLRCTSVLQKKKLS